MERVFGRWRRRSAFDRHDRTEGVLWESEASRLVRDHAAPAPHDCQLAGAASAANVIEQTDPVFRECRLSALALFNMDAA